MVAEYAHARKSLATPIEFFSPPLHAQNTNRPQFVQTSVALLKDTSISAEAKLLYQILMSYARQYGKCWPSQTTLANDVGLKPRRIADLLKQLVAARLIQVESRAEAGTSNIYHLTYREATVIQTDGQRPYAKKREGGTQKIAYPPMQKIADESDQREVDQREVDHTEKGINTSVCAKRQETYPEQVSKPTESESSAEARDNQQEHYMGYVARSTRQKCNNPTGQLDGPPRQNAVETVYGTTKPDSAKKTHTAAKRSETPADNIQDALEQEIASQLAEYGIWAKRTALLAAQARIAGRSLDDIRAMYNAAMKGHNPAALLAMMIANNAAPPAKSVFWQRQDNGQIVPAWVQPKDEAEYQNQTEVVIDPLYGTSNNAQVLGAKEVPQSPPAPLTATPEGVIAPAEPPSNETMRQTLNVQLQQMHRDRPSYKRPSLRYARQDGDTLMVRFIGNQRPEDSTKWLRQIQQLYPSITQWQQA